MGGAGGRGREPQKKHALPRAFRRGGTGNGAGAAFFGAPEAP